MGGLSCFKRASRAPALSDSAGRPAVLTQSGPVGLAEAPPFDGEQAKLRTAAGEALQRKIIRTAEITLLADSYEQAREAIEEMARGAGGYLQAAQADRTSEGGSFTLVLRVPSRRLPEVSHSLARLGKILHESMTAEEVTAEYYDTAARLGNARRLETRLLELLAKQTGKVSDLLEVERELGRVREQIERFQGQIRLYDHQVELSALTVHVLLTPPPVAAAPGLGEDLREALAGSWQTLRSVGRGLLVLGVALLPWSPLFLGAGWLARRAWRRRRHRRSRSGEIVVRPPLSAA